MPASATYADSEKNGQNPEAHPLRILALGDSYTIGEKVASNKRWPVQLTERLREAGLNVGPPRIIARTGWTTRNLETEMSLSQFTPPYDLVTLLIGVNDQYQGYDENYYSAGFTRLIKSAIELAGSPEKVMVLSIPDYSVTPFGQRGDAVRIASELETFNRINERISHENGVRYFNITPISQKALENSSLLASDGLHPSAQMYKLWVDEIFQATLTLMKTL